MDTSGLSKDNISLEALSALFPTRKQRVEQIILCVKNIRQADKSMAGQSQEQRQAITDYCLLQQLVTSRLQQLNDMEQA